LLIFSGILIVIFYQPVFITRFIYPTVGVLLLGLAFVIAQWRTEAVCIISAFLLLFAAKTYNSQLHYQYNEDSVPALHAFMETVGEDALIICDEDAVKCIVEYLYPKARVENDTDVENMDATDRNLYYFVCDESSLEENKAERVGEIELMYHSFAIYKILNEG